MRLARVPVLAVLCAALGCGPGTRGPAEPEPPALDLPPATDAPYELADNQDLETVRHQYVTLDPDDPERSALRARLADEYARRIDRALASPRTRPVAFEALVDLASLWQPADLADPEAAARTMGAYLPQARAVRESFARSGGDREAATALVIASVMDPAGAGDYRAELELIFAFVDELAVARFGPGAERSRVIDILETAVDAVPAEWAVDRLVELYLERQQAVHRHFEQEGADFNLVRAHGESVLRTTWNLVRVLARAGRLDEAPAVVARSGGIGDDDEVRAHLARALGAEPTPAAWIALADDFRLGDPDKADPRAALRVLEAALERFPDDATIAAAAGATARDLDNLPLAIRHYECAAALDPDDRDVAENLAELYEIRIGDLVFNDRSNAAREHLEALERFHARAAERWPDRRLGSDLAAAYASMGRGLVSLGELDDARGYLERSVALRPTYGALEFLGTIALKQDRFADAVRFFDRALKLPNQDPNQLFARAKILRLAGEAYAGAGKDDKARAYWRAALRSWDDLISRIGDRLLPRFRGEALSEAGRLHWALGDRDEAIAALELAVDLDPDGADTYATVVSFFITHGDYRRALDAYHRALGSREVGDYFKVYMSLWILAEARRTGEAPDPLARDYLVGRDGRLWYDDLARYATGRTSLSSVEDRATSRARRAELLYYAAVLSEASSDPKRVRTLLRQVLATDMVLFFEYDMAKHWLSEGFGAPAAAK